MASNFMLVLWTKTKKKNVVPQDAFEKEFKSNGKELPLREGALRKVTIEGKRYEAKVLRISASKKYLQSLLVTKEGEILLHGTNPLSPDLLAKRSNLVSDDTEKQKAEKNVLRALNSKAEEQPPNVRLDGIPECNDGCSNCCKKKTLPHFPKLPDGFVTTLVSLAEYFQHFHKSTAVNILAAGKALASMIDTLHPWQLPSVEKIELKNGTGVWINATHLQRIVTHAEQTRKPPHQAVVKSLLTYLLGKQVYMETSAEKIDRRLMSGVVGYANDRYPTLAQPIERYYRSINLNRTYLLKRKYETPQVSEAHMLRRQNADDILTLIGELNSKRSRLSSESLRASQPITVGNPVPSVQSDRSVMPLHSEAAKSVPTASSNNINKIIVLQRSLPSAENTHSTPVYSNPPQSGLSVINNNRFSSSIGNVLASSTRLNVQHAVGSGVGIKSVSSTGNFNALSNPIYSNVQSTVTTALNAISNSKLLPNSGNFITMTSSSRPASQVTANPVINNTSRPMVNAGSILASAVRPISTQSGTVLVNANRLLPSSGSIMVRNNRLLPSSGNVLTSSIRPQSLQTASGVAGSPVSFPNTANVVRSSIQPNSHHIASSTLTSRRSLPNSGSILIQSNQSSSSHQTNITTLNQLGSFRFASPSNPPSVPPPKPVTVKIEENFEIEGALDITL